MDPQGIPLAIPGDMKAVKTRKNHVSRARNRAVSAQKSAELARKRRWTTFYVALQAFVIIGTLLAITRCSPLAPSSNLVPPGATPPGANGQNSPAHTVNELAAEESARALIAQSLEQRPLTIPIVIIPAKSMPLTSPEKPIGVVSTISLSKEERLALAGGKSVTLGILGSFRRMNFTKDNRQKAFAAIHAIPEDKRKVIVRVYVLESHHKGGFSTTAGYFRMNQTEGLIRLLAPAVSSPSEPRRAIQDAYQIDVDIHGN